MSTLKALALVALLPCLVSPSVVADEMSMQKGQMLLMGTDGRMHILRKPDKALYDFMMKKGEPMPAAVIMMMTENGKMVISKDIKMDDGKALSEVIKTK